MQSYSGSTAAAATPTIARLGVYSRVGSTYTLLASVANDTSLWSAANTTYTTALTTPFNKVAGSDYAIGCLIVSGAAMPTFIGPQVGTSGGWTQDALLVANPLVLGRLAAQADLPATTTQGALVAATGVQIGHIQMMQ